jgi:hypothetical protein
MRYPRLAAVLLLLSAFAFPQIRINGPVDASNDDESQNETPIAINPTNPANMITGANDWNYNDGCAVSYTTDGGKTWSGVLPEGYLPAITKFTNDPSVPGIGAYDAGGDPYIAFGPDGTAYYVCQSFNFTSPYQIALLISRSSDGGKTWLDGISQKPAQISTWNGNGKSKGSNGQFPDHESLYIDTDPASRYYGSIYVTWVQFDGNTHSPVYVAYSRDGARTFSAPAKITAGNVRNNEDARVVSAPDGTLYLTFDNGVQGNKGTVLYISKSTDGGATWSTPFQFATLANPVCTFPPYCFNISGNEFRAGGTYPSPAYDPVRNRLYVVYADIAGPFAQVYLTWASAADITAWTAPVAVAASSADRFEAELSAAPNGRLDLSFYDRGYSNNKLVDLTYATSNDGGTTWATKRVTPLGFDPGLWGVPSGSSFRPFIGDYNGIASTATGAVMTWTGFAKPQPLNLEIEAASSTVK